MNIEKQSQEQSFSYLEMVTDDVDMNEMGMYDGKPNIPEQSKENKNFTLDNLINQWNLNENNQLEIEEYLY